MVVTGSLWATPDEAIADAATEARRVIRRYLATALPRLPEAVPSVADVREEFVRDIYVAEIPKDYGTMYQARLLVELSPRKRAAVVDRIARARQREAWSRAFGILALLFTAGVVLLTYVKLDDLTLGYYRTPLRLITTAVLVTVTAITLWLSGWIGPLTVR